MKYDVTYACGHKGRVQLYGPEKERQRILDWYHACRLCPDCWETEKVRRQEQAAAENAEMGFPVLRGSEKQIAWAESIRRKAWDIAQNVLDCAGYNSGEVPPDGENLVRLAVNEFFGHDEARWYIDNEGREDELFTAALRKYAEAISNGTVDELEDANAPETFTPVGGAKHEGDVAVRLTDDGVDLLYPKDEDFRQTVKALGCKWRNCAWHRTMDPLTVPGIADFTADTANALLQAGFAVTVNDPRTKELLRTTSWTPINPLVITYDEHYRSFRIHPADNDEVRKLAEALPRALSFYSYVAVPVYIADALVDLADACGINWSKQAAAERDIQLVKDETRIAPREVEDISIDAADLRHEEDLSDLIDD